MGSDSVRSAARRSTRWIEGIPDLPLRSVSADDAARVARERALDELDDAPVVLGGVDLDAHLRDDTGLRGGFPHEPRLVDVVRERLFAIDGFAGRSNGDDLFAMQRMRRGDDIEKEKAEKLRAAVNEYPRLQEMMRRNNRYDFDDMINWVIRAFEENAGLLSNYQEKYQYLLVDEYQDTSGTQNRIVELLISYWEKPNIFVVGDENQLIYEWRSAQSGNLSNFGKVFEGAKTLFLGTNYRSTGKLVEFFNRADHPVHVTCRSLRDAHDLQRLRQHPEFGRQLPRRVQQGP